MADFEQAFQRLMRDEGVVLTDTPNDKGGLTFCGISRKFHPKWSGWRDIDVGSTPSIDLVRSFYRETFWEPIRAQDMIHQRVAEVVFSQFVNMGSNGIKLMQTTLGLVADGVVGTKTISALNRGDEELFLMRYSLTNVARYHAIGMKDKTQRRFWPGWIKRALDICK